jgi:hypothetical protein
VTPARSVDTLAEVQHNRAAVNLPAQLGELLRVESFGDSMMGARDRLYRTRPTLCKLVIPSSEHVGGFEHARDVQRASGLLPGGQRRADFS